MKKQEDGVSVEQRIVELLEAGKSKTEIAKELGLEMAQVVWWVNRYSRKQRALSKDPSPVNPGLQPRER